MPSSEEWPDGANFYATLTTQLGREAIARRFGANGWSVRKCSWEGFEIRCEWAVLVIDGEAPVLLHGSVVQVNENAPTIVSMLREAQISYVVECYGEDGGLIQQHQWSWANDT